MATESDNQRKPLDVLIIGAGWSGLLACKYCKSENLSLLVLDERETLGGVWAYTDNEDYGGVMEKTESTSSKCITEMSDFPMPESYPDFVHHSEVMDYLRMYCEHFGLNKHVRFGEKVVRARKENDLWIVHTEQGHTFASRSLIVSTGVHRFPNDLRDDVRFTGFTGEFLHSASIKKIDETYRNKVVAIWGGGESASDIAYETSLIAESVFFCIPNGQWFVPKSVERWPPFPSRRPKVVDQTSSRLRMFLSPTHLYSPFISQYLQATFGFNGHGLEEWKSPAPYNRAFFNKSSRVLSEVESGNVVPKKDITRCEGKLVHFSDGSSAEVDTVFLCSGYRTVFPFLENGCVGNDPKQWYKHIFCNEDPSLAFVGFVRPVFGSIPGIAEIQSRLIALVFAGKCPIPNIDERTSVIQADSRFWAHHFRHTSQRISGLVDHFLYCDQIASLIGCRPNFWRLFLRSPFLWWTALTAPWNGCQYWLNEEAHHERIYSTFRRYGDNRISQVYVFILLSPILLAIGAYLRIKEKLNWSRKE